MKIAVTSTGPTLDDLMEARFGRCAYFLIINPETMEFEPFENPNIALGGGAGIQSAQFMAEKGVSLVLTGNCGPNAFQTFGAAGIQVITGVSGQVRQAVEQYKSGALSSTNAPSVQSHFGMGMGMGKGLGTGRGRGMGRGMSASTWARPSQTVTAPLSKEEALKSLRDQANDLRNQIERLESSIKALEEE